MQCEGMSGVTGGNAVRDKHDDVVVVTMGAPESAVTPVLISSSANNRRKKQLVSRRQTAALIRDGEQASGATLRNFSGRRLEISQGEFELKGS